MKRLLFFTLLFIFILSGCSGKEEQLILSIQNLKHKEYENIVIKGEASLDIPIDLVSNPFEKQLIEKADKISYYLNYKQTPKLNFIDGEVRLSDDKFNFSIYSNDEKSLAFNGDGWYQFENLTLKQEKYLKELYDFLGEVLSNKDFYTFETSTPTINYNDESYKTTMYSISLTDAAIKYFEKVKNLKLNIFTYKGEVLVVQYVTDLSFETPYEADIKASLVGEFLFDSHGGRKVEIREPEFNRVYTDMADFLIDLILE